MNGAPLQGAPFNFANNRLRFYSIRFWKFINFFLTIE
jgi:hypothetical protein